ncbi:MAG TPA: peptide ABC transporter substrate-binding protein [Clostridiaceae bacterium]|jgi:peptide/nickel transport system substrate-binding protein|nr:peptide ABC transporter substrate-binding protein [Clostridiaceae bacterium]
MKPNFVKYIFIIIVISLICFAVYFIYNNNNNKNQNNIQEEVEKVNYSKEITMGISEYDTINPSISNNKEVINVSKLIFEPLIQIDEEYKISFCLAKECAKIDSKSYLIKINNEVQWSNGENLKVEDIEFTIKKLKEGKSIYSVNVSEVKDVQIIDSSTIRIDLDKEDDFFQYNLVFPIMKKNNYENGDLAKPNTFDIGTGMYKITSISSEKIVLEKNSNYREKDKNPKIEKINILLFSNMGDMYNSFKIGNIDMIHTSNINYQEYIGTMGYKAKEYKGREYDFLSINCENEILSEKEVRKAINYAIDKSNIIMSIYNNKYYVSDSPIDYGSYLYETENVSLGYNPEQSKKILSDAGWTYKNNKWQKKLKSGSNKILAFSLIVQSDNSNRVKVAEIIKENLKKVGIEITIKKVSNIQYNEYLQNKNYEMILTGINNGFSNNLEYFYGKSNIAKYNNDEVKEIINEVKNITDVNKLTEKYKRLFEIVQDDVPYISLYRNKNILILNQKVGGEISPTNYSLFYKFWTWYKQE